MLFLCIYVCKYICVSVHTCLIVQNMYHCSLPVTFKRQVGFYLHSFSRPSSRRQLIVLEKGNVKRHLCLASLLVDWRGSSLPTDEEFPFSVPPVLACFVCIMVVLPYRNLLLCGGISKPVVHYRSLISPLHCSLCVRVRLVCELISTVLTLPVHGGTTTGIEWSAAFEHAHLRVWRATIKQDFKHILLF